VITCVLPVVLIPMPQQLRIYWSYTYVNKRIGQYTGDLWNFIFL